MVKTNFTKVDAMVDSGLRKMNIERVFDEASPRKPLNEAGIQTTPLTQPQKELIAQLKHDLQVLQSKKHNPLYSSLEIKKSELKRFVDKPDSLKPEEWDVIKRVRERIENYRKELAAQIPEANLDACVQRERELQAKKRFNVKDKWIPLK